MKSHLLLKRLDEIGQSLEQSPHALALIGLGSVGLELYRLDDYSDLDFFVIVEPGYKHAFINDLDWLSKLCPIAYCFLNSVDGYKLLFTDGIFCEFAVFEPDVQKVREPSEAGSELAGGRSADESICGNGARKKGREIIRNALYSGVCS